ncbi:MAG: sugar nucleotide-binding protein, partial [Rhodospirillaceae bacterium]
MSGNGKILVLGASSFVGRHLVAKLGAERVIATYNTNPIEGFRKFDSTTMAVDDVIDDWSAIDAAVLLLGDTQPDSCIADPERSRAVNVTAIARVVDRLAEKRVPIVFTSSEFVFDGHRGGYAEIDAAEPILLYGAQKLEAESHLAARTPDYAILRLAKIYGLEPGDGTLFTGMLNTVTRGGAVKCAADQRFSPVFVGDVADAIIAAVEKPLRGVYHVCG